MKRKLFFIFLYFFLSFPVKGVTIKVNELPPQHKQWLEEEVVYIILPTEREVFLQLETDKKRDLFIEAFWNQRDPTPGTPENEVRKEHYRRLNHANHFFGRGTPKPGWKTDRGRVYIILGEPNDILKYEGKTQVYPSIVWFYQGKVNLGLPSGFNLVFYQQSFSGEYKFYSPINDGPMALMTSYYGGDSLNYIDAYQALAEIEPELAEVSLTLIPGAGSDVMGQPSLASELLIQKIATIPQRQIIDKYAQKFLQYKDIIEVEYTANYIESNSLITIAKDPSGSYFVHYAIEPERLSVNYYENKYCTVLKLNGTVKDMEEKTIYQYEKTFSLEFDQEQMKTVSKKPFELHDMFPLIPGNYKFSVLVKNEASKEFTSLESDLIIPEEEVPLQMTSILLGYRMEKQETKQQKIKPFRLGPFQIYFLPDRIFCRTDSLVVSFQLYGVDKHLSEKGELRFSFLKNDDEFRSFSKKLSELSFLPNVGEKFPLNDFPPGYYRVQVSLMAEGKELLYNSKNFEITYRETMPRPWIYSKILPGPNDPIYSHVAGIQLFNSGKIEQAQKMMEEAYHKKPDSAEYALNLAQLYFFLAEYKKVEPILLPFLQQPRPKYEIYYFLGKAYQSSGKLNEAIDIFNKAISDYGLNIHLLNSLGECYFQLGIPTKALMVWEKSLEINPDQPQIEKNVAALK